MADEESLLYRILAQLLFAGVMASLVLMGFGYVLLVLRGQAALNAWLPVESVLPRLIQGDPRAILDLGVLVLLATPVVRVIAAIALFAAERQPRYVAISTAVLLLLLASVVVAVH